MSSPRQVYGTTLLHALLDGDQPTVDPRDVLAELSEPTMDHAMSVVHDLIEADWITFDEETFEATLTDHAYGELTRVGTGRSLNIISWLDSGRRAGSRCHECGSMTDIDAQYSATGGTNFCGACGAQLTPDDVLEIRDRDPDTLRERDYGNNNETEQSAQ